MHKVERAEKSDIEELARLEQSYIPCPWSENQLLEALDDNRYSLFVVRFGGKAVCYGGVCFALDEAEICNVVTDEKFRGAGYASSVIDAISDECVKRGVKKIFLEVAENNAPAKKLYLKKGFEKISERKNYYGANLTAEIMRKDI